MPLMCLQNHKVHIRSVNKVKKSNMRRVASDFVQAYCVSSILFVKMKS